MTIDLYVISKYDNSALIPDQSALHKQVTGVFKNPVDILHPVLELQAASFDNPYNYAKITVDGKTRYYFIRNKVHPTNAIIEAHLDEDYLATWFDDFKNTSQFVTRAFSNTDPYITDGLALSTNKVSYNRSQSPKIWAFDDGFYVLGIMAYGIADPLDIRGAVSYVIMTWNQLYAFISQLLQLSANPANAILDPLQYIASCVYIPIQLQGSGHAIFSSDAQVGPHTDNIKLSNIYSLSITYTIAVNPVYDDYRGIHRYSNVLTLHNHPQQDTAHKYINYAPYSFYKLYTGPFGEIDIDRKDLSSDNDNKLYYQITVDLVDGSGLIELSTKNASSTEYFINKVRGQVGIEIKMAQVSNNPLGVASSVMSAIGSAGSMFNGNVVSGALGIAGAGITAAASMLPRASSIGSNGSKVDVVREHFYMMEEFYKVVLPFDNRVGLPVYNTYALTAFGTGSFVLCQNAKIMIPALKEEIEAIENLLNNGIYVR